MSKAGAAVKSISLILLSMVLLAEFITFIAHATVVPSDPAIQSGGMGIGMFFSADALYLPALYEDLVVNNGVFSSWHLTPAPYFFPDMPLYLTSTALSPGGNYFYAVAIFFTLQSVLLATGIYKIYNLYMSKETAAMSVSLLFAIFFLFPPEGYQYHYFSAFHHGSFVVGVFSIYIILNALKEDKKTSWGKLTLLIIIAGLTVMSDKIIILHFIFPSLAAVGIMWLIKDVSFKKALQVIMALLSAVGIGLLLYKIVVINPTDYHPIPDKDFVERNLMEMQRIFQFLFDQNPYQMMIISAILFFGFFIIVFRNKIKSKFPALEIPREINFLFLFLFFLILGMGFVFGTTINIINVRYIVPLLLLPLIFIPIYIRILKPRGKKSTYGIGVVLMLLASTFVVDKAAHDTKGKEFQDSYRPKYVECVDSFIDETNASKGIAYYWQTKQILVLGEHDLLIGQYDSQFKPEYSINSKEWYSEKYDFALVPKYSDEEKKKLITMNGQPTDIVLCDKYDLLYYKDGITLDKFSNPELIQHTKRKDLTINMPISGETPAIILGKGNYRARVKYISNTPKEAHPATMQNIIIKDGYKEAEHLVEMPGTEGKVGESAFEFEVNESTNTSIMVWEEGLYRTEVISITIERGI